MSFTIDEEAKPLYYLVIYSNSKNNKGISRFYAGTTRSRGVLEVKIRCNPQLLMQYALRNGFKKKGGRKIMTFTIDNWETYAKVLIYAAITSNLRTYKKKLQAIEALNTLTYLDLKYWAGIITERFREQKYLGILRPARALRILLGIDKR
ncbi:hypothetical protein Smar_0574 [Staphylothermus marinus F1]|uniref:Uncharacterized protein n=1 Tax=Staphylothermus marinus (strain ATCC 43588 / DSM 3639 / JCM 9404 / F1) TaxID=399550 RepID=A3DM21_STAMF|nr:hypothetical protein [Staphylothermus marinus]ABN69681.1 hypothetical protein Smar_0574 [Staphylothermus marinus F1]